MSQFTKVLKISEVPEGSMKPILVAGKRIAIAHVGGAYFAVDDVCTHAGCSLGGEGRLEDKVIVCGCHGARYDATSGKKLAPPARHDLTTYPTRVEGDDLLIYV